MHNSGGAEACRLGQAGETAIGRPKYDGEPFTGPVNGRERLPDFIDDISIGEAKNVQYLYLSTQLKDYIQLAKDNGLEFILYVRTNGRTKLSGPLKELWTSGDIEVKEVIP